MMLRQILKIAVLALSLLVGCNFEPAPQGEATPTVAAILSPPPAEPSLTPSATPSPLVATSTPTPTSPPPSITPTPSETLGPYEHTIQAGETLGYIIQLYGYKDFSVIAEVVRINNNIPDADTLPGAGAVILIPRQTTTPTPELTEASVPTPVAVTLAVPTTIIQHIVVEGETIVGIAQQYRTTLPILSQLNPDIPFFGCDFSIPSGGPDCSPPLRVGQAVNVPAPTPTPTLSPTPSGSETPTPTPTYPAPLVVSPPQGGIAAPVPVRLDWVSVGVLQPNQFYLIQLRDTATGTEYAQVTKNTSLLLPESLIPSDGQPHMMEWTVRIAYLNEQGIYQPIGGAPDVYTFQWQSR